MTDQNVAPAGAYQAGAKSDTGFEIAAPELERMFVPSDDLFDSQWHLLNAEQLGGIPGIDINVTGVWDDYTGPGIRVGVIDDGVQSDHFDLRRHYDPTGQFDYGGNATDP